MRPSTTKSDRFPWRYLFYMVVFLYLAGDLYLFEGPIRRAIDARHSQGLENAPDESEWIAIVNREPVTKRQLEMAVMQHLYRRGRSVEDLSPKNLQITRLAVLQTLVNDTLIRQYASGSKIRAGQKEIEPFIESFESQFTDEDELEERSKGQKLDIGKRREALASIVDQKVWIENRIKNATTVTDEEVKAWYEANRKSGTGFKNPERFRASHIFLSTVNDKSPAREALIRDIHSKIVGGENFGALALKHSEDERTKKWKGDLNWFSKDRVSPDFYNAVSKLKPGEVSQPFQTDIGWHVVKLTDRKPAMELDFETLKPDIVAHLKSQYRANAVQELLLRLRKVAAIEIFPDRI